MNLKRRLTLTGLLGGLISLFAPKATAQEGKVLRLGTTELNWKSPTDTEHEDTECPYCRDIVSEYGHKTVLTLPGGSKYETCERAMNEVFRQLAAGKLILKEDGGN